MSTTSNDLDFIYAKLILIAGALSVSPLIYAAVILMLSRTMTAPATMAGPVVTWALVAAGVILIVTALAVRSMLLEPNRLLAGIRAATPSGQPAAYTPIIRAQLVPMVAAEMAGVLGIVLFILTHDLLGALVLAGISFGAMLIQLPRKSALKDLLERLDVQDHGRPA